jgi:hypothetical protein
MLPNPDEKNENGEDYAKSKILGIEEVILIY